MTAVDINGDPLAIGDIVICGQGGCYLLKKMRIRSITQSNVSLVELNGYEASRCVRPHRHVVLVKEKV